jgi:hypothetical protein
MSWSFNGGTALARFKLLKICIKRCTSTRSLDSVARNRFRWLEIVGERGAGLSRTLMVDIHVL